MPASNSSFHIPLIIHKITFFQIIYLAIDAWDLACILEENIGRERKGSMEEVFRAIEDKIRETGYDGLIDGETFYDESVMKSKTRRSAPISLCLKGTTEISLSIR